MMRTHLQFASHRTVVSSNRPPEPSGSSRSAGPATPDESPSSAAARLETEILDGIPLAAALELRVERAEPGGVELSAPWNPNRNGHGSLFGGSAIALALIAGWGLVRHRLHDHTLDTDVVIQDLDAHFDRPITGRVRVRAVSPEADRWRRLVRGLERHGRGRISIRVEVSGDGEGEAPTVLTGRFVALRTDR